MSQIKVELQDYMGSDRAISEAAWTSSMSSTKYTSKTDAEVESLVKRLAQDGHSTPFESVILRFHIVMPIQTDRQHMTHRIASHNGMSGRYRTMPAEFLMTPIDVKGILVQATGNYEHAKQLNNEYSDICTKANNTYLDLLKDFKFAEKEGRITNTQYKRLREFFRGMLPQNNMTERITVMNLRSFANYQKLRNSEHAQPEIREVAERMLDAVKAAGVAPIAIAALEAKGWSL